MATKYRDITFEEACQLYELHVVGMEYSHRWAGDTYHHEYQEFPSTSELEDRYQPYRWDNPPTQWAVDNGQPDGRLDVRFRIKVE